MQRYKVSVSKNQKKYNLVIKAEHESELRERVHQEWYSILNIEALDDTAILWEKILFEWEKDGEKKSWKVVSTDIFKAYTKLTKDLGIKINKIYFEHEKDTSEKNLIKILMELQQEYILYESMHNKSNKNSKNKWESSESKNLKKNDNQEWFQNFYLKKQLDETYKLIDFVLQKLRNILDQKEVWNISDDQRQKLKTIYNSIVKIQKTTNISKLKEVWELALLKIWSIELKSLESEKTKESQIYLKETNKLLKQIGSSKQFIQKNRDISYIIKNFIGDISFFFTDLFKKTHKKNADKKSYTYIRNILVLDRYKTRLKKNTTQLITKFYLFLLPFWNYVDKKNDILLERKVLKQNIHLLKAKISWKWFSYTKVSWSYQKVVDFILSQIEQVRNYTFILIILYSIAFIVYLVYVYYFPEATFLYYDGIYYFLLFVVLHMLLYASRTLWNLCLNFVFFYFLVIFFMINF